MTPPPTAKERKAEDIICIHGHNWSEDNRKNGLNQKGCKGCLRNSIAFHKEMGL